MSEASSIEHRQGLRRSIVSDNYDFVVIGAGVAGSAFAMRSASQGKRVLLVEAQRFPREKVCGGCLNLRAQRELQDLEILDDLKRVGAVPLQQLCVFSKGIRTQWTVPEMISVRRSTLDTRMVEQALLKGADFVGETVGSITSQGQGGAPQVRLADAHDASVQRVVKCRAVVVAAGLTRSPIQKDKSWECEIEPESRIGVQSLQRRDLLENAYSAKASSLRTLASVQPNQLWMLTGKAGYLGVCLTDGDWLDFAAAIDPLRLRELGAIRCVVDSILMECGLSPLPQSIDWEWKATPFLTRSSKVAARDGVYLLGDSLGYVEPFTGEGMSWALLGAKELSRILCNDAPAFAPKESMAIWQEWVNQHRVRSQKWARWVARQSRRHWQRDLILRVLNWTPSIRNALLKKVAS